MSDRNFSSTPGTFKAVPHEETVELLKLEEEMARIMGPPEDDEVGICWPIALLRAARHFAQLAYVVNDSFNCMIEDGAAEPEMRTSSLRQKLTLLFDYVTVDKEFRESCEADDPGFFDFLRNPLTAVQDYEELINGNETDLDLDQLMALTRLSTRLVAAWQEMQNGLMSHFLVKEMDVPLPLSWGDICRDLGLMPQMN